MKNMIARKMLVVSMLVLLCGFAPSWVLASITATVDRNAITEYDLVTLTIRASNDAADLDPDFSAVARDFEIVNTQTSQSSSISIVNGRTTSEIFKDHILVLQPKHQGILKIPAITAGPYTTQPININVQQQSAALRQQMNQLVFFETDVDTSETYVQGQIIYSVKLFYTEAIGGDFPQPPALEDAVIETIETEKRYESIIDGKRFYVLEKRYAIFPQRSGKLVIPRETFVGSRGRGGLFSQRQRVNAVSKSHTVTVKQVPVGFSGNNWIPAKSLAVSESWAEIPPVFHVGEPINRQLTLSAVGLSESLLPPFEETSLQDAKVYADPPSTEKRIGVDGITAIQVTTFGIVPTKEGELTLPEIRVPWWNTLKDREEVAIIPAATYTVLPATGQAATAPVIPIQNTDLHAPIDPLFESNPLWQYATIALGLLWLFSTWQWLTVRREVTRLQSAAETKYTVTFSDPDETRLFKDLMQSCKRDQPSEAHRQLFLWAKARYPNLESLAELGRQNSAIAQEIGLMENQLFGDASLGKWQGKKLASLISETRNATARPVKTKDLVGELNPA